MPRRRRIQEAGYVHHVISRGNDQQCLFRSEQDFKHYLTLVQEAQDAYALDIYNFVLMNNHVHFLTEPQEEGVLSKFMHKITFKYAKYYNKKHLRSGHVFEERFKDFIVQQERYFLNCLRYIDRNPFMAGLVEDPRDYSWSGHAFLAHGEKPKIDLKLHSLYLGFGADDKERQIAYSAFVRNSNIEDMDLLNRKETFLGDEEWVRCQMGQVPRS